MKKIRNHLLGRVTKIDFHIVMLQLVSFSKPTFGRTRNECIGHAVTLDELFILTLIRFAARDDEFLHRQFLHQLR